MTPNSDHIVFKAGDYMVVAPEPKSQSKKYTLLKATAITGSTITGWVESERKGLDVAKADIKTSRVIASLGPKPAPGKVYGLDLTNRFRKLLQHDFWGNVLVFTHLDNAQLKLMQRSLYRTAKKIEKMGLESYVDFVDTHLCAKQGKWAGYYKHSKDVEAHRSVIAYAPECAELQPDMMDYIVYHEFGHAVWYNGIKGKKIQLKWLMEYNRSIQPIEIALHDLKKTFKFIESHADGEASLASVLREFVNEEEEHKLWVRGILRWFHEVHHLAPRDLATIWEGQNLDVLRKLWPSKAIDSSKLAPVVTEYACLNVRELFAESFAFHCQGKTLPPRITQLIANSIQYAKATSDK